MSKVFSKKRVLIKIELYGTLMFIKNMYGRGTKSNGENKFFASKNRKVIICKKNYIEKLA